MKGKSAPPPEPPEKRKGFPAALGQFLAEQCPPLSGSLIRERIVRAIIELFEAYYPPTERMKMGQVLWYAVDANEKAGYGKRIEDCHLRPVILDIIHPDDIERMMQGMKKRARQKEVINRLFTQAYTQQGVLSQADVSSLMRLDPSTISRYIREYEQETGTIIPRRGTVHDMGRSVTHKKVICQKYFKEGKSVESTSHETHHSPAAVTRYLHDYKRVRECLNAGWETPRIAFATGLSPSLTREYIDLITHNEVKDE
jgi:hypothetical protein